MSVELPIESIRIDGGTQIRCAIDPEIVGEYADEAGELPPIDVIYDGKEYWLADGFHRWHAKRKAGHKKIKSNVHKGTVRDAVLFACGANSSHGLRRSNEDKRNAASTLLRDEEWSDWSNVKIAQACAVSETFIRKMRDVPASHTSNVRSMKPDNSTENDDLAISDNRKFVHPKTGKPATMNVTNIGKRDAEGEDEATAAKLADLPAKEQRKAIKGGPDAVAAALEKKEELPDPKSITDEADQKITAPELVALYLRREEVTRLMTAISRIKSEVKSAVEKKDELWSGLPYSRFITDCDSVHRTLRFARPYALCPYCGGRQKSCKACKGIGLVGEQMYGTYTPAELKEGAAR